MKAVLAEDEYEISDVVSVLWGLYNYCLENIIAQTSWRQQFEQAAVRSRFNYSDTIEGHYSANWRILTGCIRSDQCRILGRRVWRGIRESIRMCGKSVKMAPLFHLNDRRSEHGVRDRPGATRSGDSNNGTGTTCTVLVQPSEDVELEACRAACGVGRVVVHSRGGDVCALGARIHWLPSVPAGWQQVRKQQYSFRDVPPRTRSAVNGSRY
jgi:hypothetical protein